MTKKTVAAIAIALTTLMTVSMAQAEGEVAKGVRHDVREVDKGAKHDGKEIDKGAHHLNKERHKEGKHIDKTVKKDL